MEKLGSNRFIRFILLSGLLLLTSVMIYGMTFYSTIPHVSAFFKHSPFWLLINVVLVFSGMIILQAMIGRSWVTTLVASLVTLLWSVANLSQKYGVRGFRI